MEKATNDDALHTGVDSLHQAMELIVRRLDELETIAAEIRDNVLKTTVDKEAYTTKEAAELLQRKPFTVREWCRLGRVNAFKIESGSGAEDEWRIPHEELLRIQNEGLLELPNRRSR